MTVPHDFLQVELGTIQTNGTVKTLPAASSTPA